MTHRRCSALVLLAALGGCGGGTAPPAVAPPAAAAARTPKVRPPRAHRTVTPLAMPRHAPAPRTVPVALLTYHRVKQYAQELTKSLPDETVEPDTFFATLAALHSAGFHTITQRQFFNALVRGAALPRRPVLITVDDGYTDDIATILPMLRRFGFVATFYVITRRTHEPGFLTERQIRRLDAAGMDLGAHTRHHVPLPALAAAQAESEIAGSKADLERILGHPVYWFAYPFGAVDPSVEARVRAAGFLLAVTTAAGRPSSEHLMAIPRVHVGRNATAAQVVALAAAG